MTKRYWIIAGVLVAVLVLGGVGAGVFYWQYRAFQTRSWLETGEAAYAVGDWRESKKYLRMYLSRERNDLDALAKYADATSKVLNNRNVILADLARAYFQLADRDPNNREYLQRLMETDLTRANWADLEYNANYFLYVHPDDPMLRYYRALALDRLGRAPEAMEAYRALIDSGDIYKAEIYGYLARLLKEAGLEAEAGAVFTPVVQQENPNPLVLAQFALFRLDNGDTAGAKEILEQALALTPENLDVLFAAQRVTARARDWPQAIAYGERALELGTADARSFALLADAYQFSDRLEDAILLIRKTSPSLRADHPQLFMMQAELLLRMNRLDEVREWAKEFRAVHPDNLFSHDYIDARLLLAEGNAVSAASKLTTIVETHPEFRQPHLYLVAARLQLQDRATAKAELDAYLNTHPDDVQAQAIYQREFGGVQSLDSAVVNARALIDDPAANADALLSAASELYNKAAASNAKDEHFDLMVALAERVVKTEPESRGGYGVLAEIYANTGRVAEAAAVIERANAAGVALDDLRMVRAVIAGAQGDEATALRLYEEELAANVATPDTVVRWATLLTRKFSIDAGMRAYELGKEAVPEETRTVLSLEQLDLLARYGEPEETVEFINKLEADEGLGQTERASLRGRKKRAIGQLTQPGPLQDIDRAKELVASMRARNPEDDTLDVIEAEVMLAQTPPDVDGADAIAKRILARSEFDAEALSLAARVAEEKGAYGTALEYASRAANVSTADSRTFEYVARLQLRLDHRQEAMENLERSLNLEPENVSALQLMVETLRVQGRLERARAVLDDLAELVGDAPNSREAIDVLRARLQLERGEDLPEAEAVLRRQVENEPENIRAIAELAQVIARQGRLEEAEDLIRQFISSHKDKAEAWVVLGRHFMNLPNGPDITSAQTAITQARIIDRNNLPAIRMLIDINVRQNNITQATELCDRFLELEPNDGDVLYQKGRLLALRRDFEGALEALGASIEFDASPNRLTTRGEVLNALERYEEARADFLEVNRITGALSPGVALGMAESFIGENDFTQARRYFDRVGALRGEDSVTLADRYRRAAEALAGEGALQ